MATEPDVQHSGSVVELEFEFTDPDHPFVQLSAEERCRLILEEVVPRDADHYSEIFTVEDGDVDRLLELADPVDDVVARALSDQRDGVGLLELLVTDSCPIMTLAQEGAFLRHVDSDDGVSTLVAEVPPQIHAGRIVTTFLEKFPHAELLARRQLPYSTPVFNRRQFEESVSELFTDRQREALYTAYDAGYFEWPREINGEELADELGVSPATFHEHLRAAERKLVSFLADSSRDTDRPAQEPSLAAADTTPAADAPDADPEQGSTGPPRRSESLPEEPAEHTTSG